MRSAPLKHLVDSRRPITYGIVQAGPNIPGGVPYIRPTDMTPSGGVADPEDLLCTTPEIAAAYRRSQLRSGDLVLSIGPSYGKVMIVPAELSGANLTQGTARLAPASGVSARFLYWALQAKPTRDYWDMAVAGATFPALNLAPLSDTPMPLTEFSEQQRIADFLDDQVSRIDRALSLRMQQGETLQESLRAAAHQLLIATGQAIPLRRALRSIQTGTTPSQEQAWVWLEHGDSEAVGWLSPNSLTSGVEIAPPTRWISSSAAPLFPRFEAGSTVVVGIGATAGRVGHLYETSTGNQQLTALTPSAAVLPRYLTWSIWVRQQILRETAPFTTLPILNNETLKALEIVVPPKADQAAIVGELDHRLQQVDKARRLADRWVGLTVERKQALITAAVTGQFDVTTARAVA